MSHEVEQYNGQSSVLTVRQSAWHRLGPTFDEPPSLDYAMDICRQRYWVDKERLSRSVMTSQEEWLTTGRTTKEVLTSAYVTVRHDREIEFGVVSGDYSVVQNADAFAILRPLIDKGLAVIDTAGVLRDGADAWILVKFNLEMMGTIVRQVFSEEIIPYGLVANNFSGRRGVMLANTPVRVVCANTLGEAESGAEKDKIVLRHTSGAKEALVQASESLWGNILHRYEAMAKAYHAMNCATIPVGEFNDRIVPIMAWNPEDRDGWNPEAKMARRVLERYEEKKGCITALWNGGGLGLTGNHSAWEAYNACVEALDHHAELWPKRGGVYGTAQGHLDGDYRKMKQKVFERLMKMI